MNLPSMERYWGLYNSIGYDTAAVTTEFAQYCQFNCGVCSIVVDVNNFLLCPIMKDLFMNYCRGY